MKSSRNRSFFPSRVAYAAVALGALCAMSFCARAELAPWLRSVVSGSAIEAALYRAMDLPGVKTLYPRPPAEARGELNSLLKGKSDAAQLYALRAHSEEQALDFSAAEQDWKDCQPEDRTQMATELTVLMQSLKSDISDSKTDELTQAELMERIEALHDAILRDQSSEVSR